MLPPEMNLDALALYRRMPHYLVTLGVHAAARFCEQ